MADRKIIDVHAHCLPADYIDAMRRAGVHDVEGFPTPNWSEAEHLALMDRHGIHSAVLTVSTPGLDFVADRMERAALARQLNEQMAQMRSRTKGRFGAMALLPLPDVDAALVEIAYALDTLKLDGIGMLSNYFGTYIGDDVLDAVLAEADRRSAVVFVHPTAPPHWHDFSVGFAASALEYPFDTTRWLLRAISSGMLRKYTRVKLIATHGGGAMPFLADRVATLAAMQSELSPKLDEAEFIATLKRVWFDCTAATQTIPFTAYKALVPPNKRLFGSDHPFMPEKSIPPAIDSLANDNLLPRGEREMLEWSNAVELFPELAKLWHEEPASPAPHRNIG